MAAIRTFIQQPALPQYRVGVFRELAARPGIQLELVHDQTPDLANVAPNGFRALAAPSKSLSFAGRRLHWQSAMLEGASATRADVLVFSWNLNYLSLVPALLKARREGVGTVLWGHGYTKVDTWYRRWARERVTGLADALLFYDHTHANAFITGGSDPAKIFVAQNALDESPIFAARDSWLARPQDVAAFQRDNAIAGRDVVLFVSRLTAKARVDVLIDAVPSLLRQRPNALVVFIGGGDVEPWKRRAEALGVSGAVRFLGPVYEEMKLAPWFLSSRLFCYPSGVGLSIIHAFHYGLPIVTDDNFALHNPEIAAMRPGENGLLYRYNDATDLAAKLATLLANEPPRQQMSAAALATARDQFNLKTMVDGFEAAIRYVYARAQQRHPVSSASIR
jgi:glycosyltransferase involved in cell wall biosynthesis